MKAKKKNVMNQSLIVLFFLFVVSCSNQPLRERQMSLAELAASNQGKIAHISIGISKQEVIALMGTNTAETNDGIVNNPWTVEGFVGDDNANYEVLYYVTRRNPPFTPVLKFITTPVVLKNNMVVGWGNDAVERIGGKRY